MHIMNHVKRLRSVEIDSQVIQQKTLDTGQIGAAKVQVSNTAAAIESLSHRLQKMCDVPCNESSDLQLVHVSFSFSSCLVFCLNVSIAVLVPVRAWQDIITLRLEIDPLLARLVALEDDSAPGHQHFSAKYLGTSHGMGMPAGSKLLEHCDELCDSLLLLARS